MASTAQSEIRVWEAQQTPHFVIQYVPGTHGSQIVDEVAARAEEAFARAQEWFDAAAPGLITIYLTSVLPGRLRSGWVRVGDAQVAAARALVWQLATAAAPAVGLEQVVLSLLRERAHGPVAAAASPLLAALGALVAAESGFGPSAEEAEQATYETHVRRKRPVVLFAPEEAEQATVPSPAAVSFLAFLQHTYGRLAFAEFARQGMTASIEEASATAFGQPLAGLEQDWLAELRARNRPGAVALELVRHALPYIRRHWVREAELLVYMALALAFSLAIPLSIKFLFDDVIVSDDLGRLAGWAGIVLVVFTLSSLAGYRRTVVAGLIGELVLEDMRRAGFAQLQRLSLRFYNRSRSGDLLSRLTNDMDNVQEVLGATLPEFLFQVLGLLASSVMLILLNWMLGTLVLVLGIPILALVYSGASGRLREASRDLSDRIGEMTAYLQEHLGAQLVVKAFSLERHATMAFDQHLRQLFDGSMRMIRIGAVLSGATGMVYMGIQVTVLAAGGYLVMTDRMSMGELVAFSGLIGQVLSPALAISNQYRALQVASGSFERVQELMSEVPDVAEAAHPAELVPLTRAIRVDHVTFRYGPGGEPALRDVSLTIPAGSRVAIVGPSGSGKSTTVGLFLRLYDPDEGGIRFDDEDLRTASFTSVRQQIALVPQDIFLFNATIRDNIALGREGAGHDDVLRAARAAELHEVITRTERGYDTMVGERGVRLSGGQRQRLAIARALIRDPRILILDEATSALDPHTEAEILRTLDQVARGRTTIMITHRLTSAVTCDRIFVLEQGALAEEGTHAELCAQQGLYWRLYTEQVQASAAEPEPILLDDPPDEA